MSKRENATMKIAFSDRMPNARSTTASMSPNIPEMIVHTTLVTKVDYISSSLDQQIFLSTTSNLPDRGCIQVGLITNLYCVLYNRIMQRRLASRPRGQSYYKSSSVCLFVCLSVCSLSPPRSFDRSSPNLVGVCRWTSELPLRGSFSKRSTARRVNGSLSLSTILYMCQPHSTQLQKATLLLLHLIRLKGTFCCIDGWWVYVGGSRN